MNIYVQFSDQSETEIVSYFTCAQDPEQWPNQGMVEETDPRYKAYYDSLLPIVQSGMPTPSGV